MTKKTFYSHVLFSAFPCAGLIHFVFQSKDVGHQMALMALMGIMSVLVVRTLRDAISRGPLS